MNRALRVLASGVAFAFFTAFVPAKVFAEVILTYSAPPFTSGNLSNPWFFGGTEPVWGAGAHVSVEMELAAPLAPGLVGASVTPLTFAMSDGNIYHEITESSPGLSYTFNFWTDAGGGIVDWILLGRRQLAFAGPTSWNEIYTGSQVGGHGDLSLEPGLWSWNTAVHSDLDHAVQIVANQGGPAGTWQYTVATPVPEPNSLFLFAAGLVGLAAMRRQFKT